MMSSTSNNTCYGNLETSVGPKLYRPPKGAPGVRGQRGNVPKSVYFAYRESKAGPKMDLQ